MDREQVLRDTTHKNDGIDTGRRVFYTLTDHTPLLETTLAVARTAKLLGLLVQHLEQSGKLSPADIDELLLETAQ